MSASHANYLYKTTPMQHQSDVFHWAQHGGKLPLGAEAVAPDTGYKDYFALFMEQGTGKSKTVLDIAVDDYVNGRINGLLIIAPNDVHKQWYLEQIPIHVPIPYLAGVYGGNVNTEMKRRVGHVLEGVVDDRLNILCVNVDTFSSASAWEPFHNWVRNNRVFVVIDEATVIKNMSAKRTERIVRGFCNNVYRGKTLKQSTPFATRRAVLTGTPITNGPLDTYPMLEFLQPLFSGRSYYSFKMHFGLFYKKFLNDDMQSDWEREITVPIDRSTWGAIRECYDYKEASIAFGVSQPVYDYIKQQTEYEGAYRNLEELRDLIRPVAYFIKKADCLDLPDKIYKKRMLQMTPKQQKIYNELHDQFITEFDDHTVTAKNKLVSLIRLSQVCSGFLPVTDIKFDGTEADITTEIVPLDTKNPKANALIEDISFGKLPALVVTRFTAEALFLYHAIKKAFAGARVGLYIGTQKIPTNPIEAFKEGEIDILVANNKMIRMGWNLQNCSDTYIFSNDFSLETRLQMEDRTHRIGQTESPTYNDYMMLDTVDMKIYAALKQKKKVADYITATPLSELLSATDDSVQLEFGGLLDGSGD